MGPTLQWWLHTDASLLARIGIGAAIFAALAVGDLIRRGRQAARWREYLFLVFAAGVAMAYGVINDRIASAISWEYFYYGKGLDEQLGPRVPPDQAALQWAACKVGLKATWSAGLIVGVAMLLANNPRRGRKQMPYGELLQLVFLVFFTAATFAAIGAWIGSRGWLNWSSADLSALWHSNQFHPQRFTCVYGMNLGGYIGGIIGTGFAVFRVRRSRA